jgi:hypothetical protein
VTMLDVVEHLPDPLATLRVVYSTLKERCPLYIVTPNFASLFRHLLGAQAYGVWPDEHLYYFTSASLRKMLQAAGFKKIRTGTRDIYHPNISALISKLGAAPKRSNGASSPSQPLRDSFHSNEALRRVRNLGNWFFQRLPWGDKLIAVAWK